MGVTLDTIEQAKKLFAGTERAVGRSLTYEEMRNILADQTDWHGIIIQAVIQTIRKGR